MPLKITADWQSALDACVRDLFDQLVQIRRHLHAHPELSGQERQTTVYLLGVLRQLGIQANAAPGGCGILVDSPGAEPAPRVALRADMDALPIHETRDSPYRSQTPGVMHACGHDGHTATVIGAILALERLRHGDQLPCPVAWRAIFQPAEETLTGACQMIDAGALDGVDAILSLHMDPSRNVGTMGVRDGVFTANCDTLEITIAGRGGHGARPHQTIDPIAAAAQLVTLLYTQLPRRVDSQDAVVLSFGQIASGEAANVIPSQAILRGTLRTLDAQVRQQAKAEIERIARAVADATGARLELGWSTGIAAVINDSGTNDYLRRAGSEVVGLENVQQIARPSMGSEDFASYLQHVPGAMFRLGCASAAVGNSGLHTPTFDIDEQSLAIGARILARAAIYWSQDRAPSN
jgi:amidohydrolase